MRLETSRGKGIDNFREPEVTDYERNWDRHIGSLHPKAVRRTEASGSYNCHGLVFATRRTNIDSPSQIQTILQHDSYREIPLAEVKPGDIVVYYSDRTGDANHSALVVAYDIGTHVTPIVCSKWGKYAEYVHGVLDCPTLYGPIVKYFRCQL